MLPPVVDSHCHLTNDRFADDLPAVVERARVAGLGRCLVIGTGIDDAEAGLALAERFGDVLAFAAGLDPFSCHAAGERFAEELARLRTLLSAGRHCALGEIGLEYHHELLPHPVQIEQLEAQLALARELRLPAIIHVRDAHTDMLATLARHAGTRGVIHSFIGTDEEARRYLDLGWHLAFNGTVTFKANDFLRRAARIVPADRLLIETDSPYLAPVPMRGRRCEPAFVLHTLSAVAELRGERVEDVAAWTTRNAVELFRWKAMW